MGIPARRLRCDSAALAWLLDFTISEIYRRATVPTLNPQMTDRNVHPTLLVGTLFKQSTRSVTSGTAASQTWIAAGSWLDSIGVAAGSADVFSSAVTE